MKNWKEFEEEAIKHKVLSESYLKESVVALMLEKGFTEKQANLFDACFAGGCENVITFNGEGEFADLSIDKASMMTKEKITKYISRYLDYGSLKLIKEE